MEVGVHIVFAARSEPAEAPVEVGVVGGILVEPERPCPSEKLLAGSFPDDGDAVVGEAEIALLTGVAAAEDISADDAEFLRLSSVERLELAQRHSREGADVSRLDSGRTAYCHLAEHIVTAPQEELSYGCKAVQGHCPYGLVLAYRGDVADLHSDIAYRVFALEEMHFATLQTVEVGAWVALSIEAYVNGTDFGECIDTGLESCDFVAIGEVHISCCGSRIDCRYEDSLRSESRVCKYAVRALYEYRPQASCEQGRLHFFGAQVSRILLAEVQILLFAVGLDQYCEKLSLLAPDYFLYGSACRSRNNDVRVLFVRENRRSREHAVTFLYQKTGQKSLEILRLDGNDVADHSLAQALLGRPGYRNVETLFQNNGFGHFYIGL